MTRMLTAGFAGAFALTLVQAALARAMPLPLPAGIDGGQALWGLVSNAVLALALAGLAKASTARGVRLTAMLFLVAVTVLYVANFIEAIVFGVLTAPQVAAVLPHTVIPLAFAVPAVVVLTRQQPSRSPIRPRPEGLLIRGAACALLYLVCYFVAGMIVYPWVESFYATRTLPPLVVIASLQLFVRGPLFVTVIGVLAWHMAGTRAHHAVAGAALMALVGGVVPLIVPNQFLPDAVRWAHFWEVVISNGVFGAITGWAMSPARAALGARTTSGRARHEELAHGQAK